MIILCFVCSRVVMESRMKLEFTLNIFVLVVRDEGCAPRYPTDKTVSRNKILYLLAYVEGGR